jgi:hypothetical protein
MQHSMKKPSGEYKTGVVLAELPHAVRGTLRRARVSASDATKRVRPLWGSAVVLEAIKNQHPIFPGAPPFCLWEKAVPVPATNARIADPPWSAKAAFHRIPSIISEHFQVGAKISEGVILSEAKNLL